MSIKRIVSKDGMIPQGEYLVLMPRYILGQRGVTEQNVDMTEWHLADWDGSRLIVEIGDDYQWRDFESVMAIFELPRTHTEFNGIPEFDGMS